MSELKTTPVFKCKRCGRTYTARVRTLQADPDGKLLYQLLKMVEANGLCTNCSQKKTWYYSQGRSEEWERGV